MRAGILQHQNIRRLDLERRIVDPRRQIAERGKHHRAAFVLEQFGVGRRAFEDGALRRQIAEQRDQAALRFQRLVERRDDRAVDITDIVLKPLAQRLAGHREAIEMQQRL